MDTHYNLVVNVALYWRFKQQLLCSLGFYYGVILLAITIKLNLVYRFVTNQEVTGPEFHQSEI